MNWLNNLSIRFKLLLLTIPLSMFAVILTGLLITAENKLADRMTDQLRGLEMIERLIPLVQLTPQHRGTTNAYLNGNEGIKSKVLDIRGKINDAYATLLSDFKDEPAFMAELKQINKEWSTLSERAFREEAKPTFQAHTEIILELLELMVFLADEKSLVTAQAREQ